MTLCNSITDSRSMKAYSTLLNRFIEVHRNKYDYSKSVFKGTKIKITIVCPIHGEFQQTPTNHLSGRGCRKCGNKINNDHSRKTTEQFIKESNSIWTNKYDYSNVNYIDNRKHVEILCKKHNTKFKQRPYSHLKGIQGCPDCVKENKSLRYLDTLDNFISKARLLHDNKYSYNKFIYVKSGVPGDIICNSCTRVFTQSPNSHLRGSGCPYCAQYGFDSSKPTTLYYLSINDGEAYKIGITNRTIKERFISDFDKISILAEIRFSNGVKAKKLEKWILNRYSNYKWKGPDLLTLGGNTELFTKDVLNLRRMNVYMDRTTRSNI